MVMYAADAGGDARRGVGGNDGQQRWATAMGGDADTDSVAERGRR